MSDATRRILVAAEDAGKLEPLLGLLRAAPLVVDVVGNEAARARLERGERFDLLVVDIEPPELAGFEVIKAYRRAPGAPLPVLALSESFKREHIEGMLENVGVRRLFPLSVRPEELLFWVNHALFPDAMRSRKAPRIPASFVLSIAGRRRVLRGRAFNLSEDGLFLETSLAAAPGERVELRFRLPGQPRREEIRARCEVMWSNPKPRGSEPGHPPYGLGLRFLELEAKSRTAIKSYVLNSLLELTI